LLSGGGFAAGADVQLLMHSGSHAIPIADPPDRCFLTPPAAILLAVTLGFCGGYLELVVIVLKKYCWNDLRYFWSGSDFVWSIPLAHAVTLLLPGALIAVFCRLLPGRLRASLATWALATLAIWAALLRAPMYGAATLILAAGLGRLVGGAVERFRLWHPRRLQYPVVGLLGLLVAMAAVSSGGHATRHGRPLHGTPAPSARNAVLIVWDTVRAYNVSLNGYPRETTPNLKRWAREGVRYTLATAAAPWTYPSHSCFFTGQWPFKLNSQWKNSLEGPDPTLAEYLSARGYDTAGFAANTNCCHYETGLDRGFSDYEDYPLSPSSLLARTALGNWFLSNVLHRGDAYAQKWVRLQSRNAQGINDAFLDWLSRRRSDRPFFAFLNEFDAHDPYIPPPEYAGRFGIRPETPRDDQLVTDFVHTDKSTIAQRDVEMAADCYDDCIAYLDDQLGRLLGALRMRGLLDNTVVIITSDHGESFGDHGVFGHGSGLHLDQIGVPLVILSPGAPKGLVVDAPVSLHDLPATLVDQLGLEQSSPFPGRSLAALWRSTPGKPPRSMTPAFSEIANPPAFQPQSGLERRGLQMSLVVPGWHYLRDGMGDEQLYDLWHDPFERVNLMHGDLARPTVADVRRRLLAVLKRDHGSVEVENAYLKHFRRWLSSIVAHTTPVVARH
jgi:arylsulfatase A-like enzyme